MPELRKEHVSKIAKFEALSIEETAFSSLECLGKLKAIYLGNTAVRPDLT